jgi:serine/threonine-protein kinase
LEELLKPPHEPVFTIKEVIKVADQLSNALAHCHNLDVKHGDIKSNNVKFNKHTSNYVLLDFGLAALSDEQRRTSLRHAGAIEFMAPEQSEGLVLFQSDVYGFGIILFELLAGVVPFPLHDKGESARNMVMVAHLEKAPPDLRELRRQNLPNSWSDNKRKIEMQVPEWLVSMIYRCLRKKPAERFSNGNELHEYIVLNSTVTNSSNTWSSDQLMILQQQNQQLQREKDQLQQTLLKYQQEAKIKEQQLQTLQTENDTYSSKKKGISVGVFIATIIALLTLGGVVYILANRFNDEPTNNTVTDPAKKREVIARYKVLSAKANFYDEPDESTVPRKAFISYGDPVNALDEKNGFIYTEFTNSRAQVTRGWLRKQDLALPDEWTRQNNLRRTKPADEIYKEQLKRAADLVERDDIDEALAIYKPLVDKEVPEAMYQYGNLALQDQNTEIDCARGIELINKASDKGYMPAKTTLGFLLLLAENRTWLSMNNYGRCEYQKDVQKALVLLKAAAAAGDDAAKQLLNQYYTSNPEPNQ